MKKIFGVAAVIVGLVSCAVHAASVSAATETMSPGKMQLYESWEKEYKELDKKVSDSEDKAMSFLEERQASTERFVQKNLRGLYGLYDAAAALYGRIPTGLTTGSQSSMRQDAIELGAVVVNSITAALVGLYSIALTDKEKTGDVVLGDTNKLCALFARGFFNAQTRVFELNPQESEFEKEVSEYWIKKACEGKPATCAGDFKAAWGL